VLANALIVNPSLEHLDLGNNSIGDTGAHAIACGLTKNTTLKSLDLCGNESISSAGWRTFFRTLRNSSSSLEKLSLNGNNLDDEGLLQIIVTLGSSLKYLSLLRNQQLTIVGFRALATLIQRPNPCLESLYITPSDTILDELIITFAAALVNNNTLITLLLDLLSPTQHLLSTKVFRRGWTALTNVLCNKSTIESICDSNHTLREVALCTGNVPDQLSPYLDLNKNEDKAEVIRQKIIKYHFLNGEENIQDFVDMELNELPQAISWLGRNDAGFSLLYKLCRSVPTLFDSESKTKAAECRNRKRTAAGL
jgi:hypothetical protein